MENSNAQNIFFKPEAHYERNITRHGTDMTNQTENYQYVFARNDEKNYIFIKHKIWDNLGNGKFYNHVFEASDEAYNELLEGHLQYTRKNRGRCNVKRGHVYAYHANIRYHDKDKDTGHGTEDSVIEKWIYHDVIEQMTYMQLGDLVNMDIDTPIEQLDIGTPAYRTLTKHHMAQFSNPLPPVPPYSDFLTYPNKEAYMMPAALTESEHFKTNEFPQNKTSHYHTIMNLYDDDFEY